MTIFLIDFKNHTNILSAPAGNIIKHAVHDPFKRPTALLSIMFPHGKRGQFEHIWTSSWLLHYCGSFSKSAGEMFPHSPDWQTLSEWLSPASLFQALTPKLTWWYISAFKKHLVRDRVFSVFSGHLGHGYIKKSHHEIKIDQRKKDQRNLPFMPTLTTSTGIKMHL